MHNFYSLRTGSQITDNKLIRGREKNEARSRMHEGHNTMVRVTDSAPALVHPLKLVRFLWAGGHFRLRNDLYCVGWGVKLYTYSLTLGVSL